jgi:prevent-host-death family protein
VSEIRVGVRDLKSRLSEYLRQVKQGKSIIITDHGHPVGRLSPVEQPLEERLKAMQDAGMVAWNGQNLKPVIPSAVNHSEQQVSDILVEMRE